MDQNKINETLRNNVAILSKHTDDELRMMPTATQTQLPSVEDVKSIVSLIKSIVFSDYFHKRQPDEELRAYQIGVSMEELYRLLRQQIARGLQFCEECQEGERAMQGGGDGSAVYRLAAGDKAAAVYRHTGDVRQRPRCTDLRRGDILLPGGEHDDSLPRGPQTARDAGARDTAYHNRTGSLQDGIDIHPGAQIGEYFSIDHGTGVVIGETSIIGNHVTLYQGVTLGAKSFKYDEQGNMLNIPRHPIIEDNVTVYSNASILGRITIGHDSVIGGNIWLTHSVPAYSRILQSKAVDAGFQDGLGI